MIKRQKTIKGFANTNDPVFLKELKQYEETHLNGFKKLSVYATMRNKKATEMVTIKGRFFRGKFEKPEILPIAIFYK